MMSSKKTYQHYIFYTILCLAVFLRLFKLGEIPSGLNQDEAFIGYEAWSLLTTGTDSWGYHYPLYFISWASGANVLYAYLTIPFFALLGTETWVLRLPQALFGILSCYIFYRLLRILYNRPSALIGFFLAAIIPWHLMLSRWGLESNLSPCFILAGLYFFARSIKKKKHLYPSALFYGLGLYTYATCWIYIALTFGLQLLYYIAYNHNKQTVYTIIGAGLLFTLFAFPLLLFILINNDIIPEIKTAYFSIPKLIYYRQNEIGFNDINIKLAALVRILLKGEDYLPTNRILPYGHLFPISIPFILLGLYSLFKTSIQDFKKHQLSLSGIILCSIFIGLIYSITLYPCINRLNFLWFNIIILITAGIKTCKKFYFLYLCTLGTYLVYGIIFNHTYFTDYNNLARQNFSPDLKPALNIAEIEHQKTKLPITITNASFIYPKVLFYNKIAPQTFRQTVRWQQFPAPYLDTKSFAHYHFLPQFDYTHISTDSIYISPIKQKYFFYQFNITPIGDYIIASPKL